MIAYKVVGIFNEDGKTVRRSLIYDRTQEPNKYALTYPPGHIVFPYGDSLIMAFESIPHCFNFIHNSLMEDKMVEIWEARVTEKWPIEDVLSITYDGTSLDVFWSMYNKGELTNAAVSAPPGTVGTKSIRLNCLLYKIDKPAYCPI